MKKMKKMMALMLAMIMTIAMSSTVFAQDANMNPPDKDNATITINNPAKGETYSIYKLFDATVADDGTIAYQRTESLPDELKTFFKINSTTGYVTPDDSILDDEGTKMTPALQEALEAWAISATPTMFVESDGSTLNFKGLPYGYYVITTTHKSDVAEGEEVAKSAITVTSTTPNASVYDKNVNEPSADKKVEKESYSIGDTVKYTGTFDTTNYMSDENGSKQVIKYVIRDTLPEYLSGVKVTSITIGGKEVEVQQFDEKKEITIKWAEGNKTNGYTSLYEQGAVIKIEYEATLTSTTNINAEDTNTISIRPYVDEPAGPEEPQPWKETWEDSEIIKTYAAAIKKVDESGKALAGATFTIAGLTVEEVEPGVYRVVKYDANSSEASVEMATDENGKLYIVGLAEDVTLTVTEFKAPDGYNKLDETTELNAQKLGETIYETSGERYYDADGNLVEKKEDSKETVIVEKNLSNLDEAAVEIENNKGTLLPSTGGIGTTIFYIIGGILVVGAAVLLITKKRMSKEA